MHARFASIVGGVLVVTGLGFAAGAARSVEPPGAGDQRSGASSPPQAVAMSMLVYKSPT